MVTRSLIPDNSTILDHECSMLKLRKEYGASGCWEQMPLFSREHVFGAYGPIALTMASIASGGRLSMESRNIAAEAATRRGSQPE